MKLVKIVKSDGCIPNNNYTHFCRNGFPPVTQKRLIDKNIKV